MIAFPNAKINLGLQIISKRPDGYHEMASCLYPIPWCDVLEAIPAPTLAFHASGLLIPGREEDNLCLKAYHLVRKHVGSLPPVAIYLHKVVPMGAGLGGGSSDGAHLIKLLNDLFDLQLTPTTMRQLAAKLGSDCPFFIDNTPAIASGTGTTLASVDMRLTGKYIGLLYPEVHVSTRDAYGGTNPQVPSSSIAALLDEPLGVWKETLVNDFETSIFSKHPILKKSKEKLYEMGAVYAAMSGSGSALFGIFEREPERESLDFCGRLW